MVAKATARVHSVHMMNMQWRQAAADPQPRPNNPGCESATCAGSLPVYMSRPRLAGKIVFVTVRDFDFDST